MTHTILEFTGINALTNAQIAINKMKCNHIFECAKVNRPITEEDFNNLEQHAVVSDGNDDLYYYDTDDKLKKISDSSLVSRQNVLDSIDNYELWGYTRDKSDIANNKDKIDKSAGSTKQFATIREIHNSSPKAYYVTKDTKNPAVILAGIDSATYTEKTFDKNWVPDLPQEVKDLLNL